MEEERLFSQKSRVQWLEKGDGNNRFFFNQCKANWNSNKILAIHDSSGNLFWGQRQRASVAVDYFQEFVCYVPPLRAASCNCLKNFECPVISDNQATFL